jgi:hypothetical protein
VKGNPEIDNNCPLNDLTRPNRRPEVFREGVRQVLDLEDNTKVAELGQCRTYIAEEELTNQESRLASDKAWECYVRRRDGRCALINNVIVIKVGIA